MPATQANLAPAELAPFPAREQQHCVPKGSCDSHCHVLGPIAKFPYALERHLDPPEAPLEALEELWRSFGFERAVIVQSIVHGSDHSAVIDALERGGGRYRGVALLNPETPDSEIARLHSKGFRGARVQFMPERGPVLPPDEIAALLGRVRDYDWHIALHLSGRAVADYEDLFASLPVRIVIDHMARLNLGEGPDGASVGALKRLLDRGDVWVKLSGADRIAADMPSLDDAIDLARTLAEHAPDRVLWGSDSPHVGVRPNFPGDQALVDAIDAIAPTAAARRLMLVDNPTACFDLPRMETPTNHEAYNAAQAHARGARYSGGGTRKS